MMASFFKAIEDTLKWEGGYTVDTGGATKFGISQKAYPGIKIEGLTIDQAKGLYKKDYWDLVKGDLIKSEAAAAALFDFAVNAGVSKAIKVAQKSLNELGSKIIADGSLGTTTISEINRFGDRFAEQLTKNRIKFYESLVVSNPAKYKKYLEGWKRRAASYFPRGSATSVKSLSNNPIFISALLIGAFWLSKKIIKGA